MAVWMSKPKTRLGRRANKHMRQRLGFVRRLAPPTGGLVGKTRGLRWGNWGASLSLCLGVFLRGFFEEKDT